MEQYTEYAVTFLRDFLSLVEGLNYSYLIREFIGWVGAICFAVCGFPQAKECYKNGHAKGINLDFMLLWFTGEVCTLVYIIPDKKWPLIFNYIGNLFFVCVILRYKFFPRCPVKKEGRKNLLRKMWEKITK